MQTAILTVHAIICVSLVILVLLQAGREGMGIIFGGSGNASQSPGGSGTLTKLTAFLAVLFVVTSLTYNILTSTTRDEKSTIVDVQFEEIPAPATTAPVEAAPVEATPTTPAQ